MGCTKFPSRCCFTSSVSEYFRLFCSERNCCFILSNCRKISSFYDFELRGPFHGQQITTITLQGLPFSDPLQDMQLSAHCSIQNSGLIEARNPVPFNLTSSLAEMTISFQNGGLPAGSGSYGVEMLTLTCKISYLVNAPSAVVPAPSVSLIVFGNSLPLYFRSGIGFPEIFVQSLGFRRPRVSF